MKIWYIYIMGFYLAIKKNENIHFVDEWMKPEKIVFNEITQTKKYNCSMFFLSVVPSSKSSDVSS